MDASLNNALITLRTLQLNAHFRADRDNYQDFHDRDYPFLSRYYFTEMSGLTHTGIAVGRDVDYRHFRWR